MENKPNTIEQKWTTCFFCRDEIVENEDNFSLNTFPNIYIYIRN